LKPSDVVQEADLEAHRDFAGFAGTTERELVTWLRRILVRNLTDQARRHQAQMRDTHRQQSLESLLERSSLAAHELLSAGISTPSLQDSRREQAVLFAEALTRDYTQKAEVDDAHLD
jgi:RNA polymerase sigma-70 factor (ECF subfamily)